MDIERWVIVYVALVVGEDSDDLNLQSSMALYDFDSLDAVEMAFEFEKTFGREVDPELFLKGEQTIAELIEVLSKADTPEPSRRVAP